MHPAEIKKGVWYIVLGAGPLLCNETPRWDKVTSGLTLRGWEREAVRLDGLAVAFTTALTYEKEFGAPAPSNYWAEARRVIRVAGREYLEIFLASGTPRLGANSEAMIRARTALSWVEEQERTAKLDNPL